MRCSYCGSHEHPLKLCPKTWEGSARRKHYLYCTYCGSRTHTAEYCIKTWEGPANRKINPEGLFID